jgi:hypothetical protein
MIERLPLDIFDDKPAKGSEPAGKAAPVPSPAPAPSALPAEPTAAEPSGAPAAELPEAPAGIPDAGFLVSCQWCGEQFDNELPSCPHCGGTHRRVASPADDSPLVSCQWCLAAVEPGAERCPQCDARIVVPGQYIAGQDDPPPLLASYDMRVRQAQSQQMLAGMMLGGGLDSLVGGLIGLALTLFDD